MFRARFHKYIKWFRVSLFRYVQSHFQKASTYKLALSSRNLQFFKVHFLGNARIADMFEVLLGRHPRVDQVVRDGKRAQSECRQKHWCQGLT